ncbi:MAG: hypothetical protein JNK74_06930 [Candidatus Hydrogenedentes bacterium]|nr:hypothetical protein [Candidatus Hydrogenedentota bacterium]
MRNQFSRREDFWAHLIADVVVRIGLFGATFVLMMVNMPRRYYRDWDGETISGYMYVALVAGVLAAILGPWFYHAAVQRGRGTLGQVKRDSERRK